MPDPGAGRQREQTRASVRRRFKGMQPEGEAEQKDLIKLPVHIVKRNTVTKRSTREAYMLQSSKSQRWVAGMSINHSPTTWRTSLRSSV